jgi:hypothetical protein
MNATKAFRLKANLRQISVSAAVELFFSDVASMYPNNISASRDRCYDLLNIFAEKLSKKIGAFDSKQS